jgi:hypothetical protein
MVRNSSVSRGCSVAARGGHSGAPPRIHVVIGTVSGRVAGFLREIWGRHEKSCFSAPTSRWLPTLIAAVGRRTTVLCFGNKRVDAHAAERLGSIVVGHCGRARASSCYFMDTDVEKVDEAHSPSWCPAVKARKKPASLEDHRLRFSIPPQDALPNFYHGPATELVAGASATAPSTSPSGFRAGAHHVTRGRVRRIRYIYRWTSLSLPRAGDAAP